MPLYSPTAHSTATYLAGGECQPKRPARHTEHRDTATHTATQVKADRRGLTSAQYFNASASAPDVPPLMHMNSLTMAR